MAAAVKPVPKITPPVLVKREVEGTELMMEAAFSSGVGSIGERERLKVRTRSCRV